MYLDSRLSGRTGDISARFSYQLRNQMVSKQDLCRIFGWSEEKPIIAVYASNWFDFPHCGGLENFRDFYDWIALSMDVAARTTGVNWIFKAHPCDEWYGGTKGVTMEQMLERLDQPHVRLADTSWNGQALIKALDGIVTCHGTIGMEATYMGTPVLTAYSGWYRGGRFVREAESRQDYIDLLQSEWWQGLDREKNATNAALFAGWYFGVPAWHGDYLFEDDSEQDRIYARLPEFLTRFAPQIDKEVALLRAWHADGHPYSHIFKMLNAESHHYPSGGGQ
jgi:hypothetical protein